MCYLSSLSKRNHLCFSKGDNMKLGAEHCTWPRTSPAPCPLCTASKPGPQRYECPGLLRTPQHACHFKCGQIHKLSSCECFLHSKAYCCKKKKTRFRQKIRNNQSCKSKTGVSLSSADTWTSSPSWHLCEGRAQLLKQCTCSASKCHKNLKHPVSPTYSCIFWVNNNKK